MVFDYLQPLSKSMVDWIAELPDSTLGKKVVLHTEQDFPDLTRIKIAVFCVEENRGSKLLHESAGFNAFRKQFYKLFPGNWEFSLADLGDLPAGNSLSDTYFALKTITAALLKNKIIPIVIGGSQDLTYPIYRAYDELEQMVNIVSIDSKFDLGDADHPISAESYLSKIIIDWPNNLFNFSNLGYQTYFNSQEEIDLIDKMYFEAYRLGELVNDVSIAEPVLRDADIVTLDFNVIKSSYSNNFEQFQPNGFNGIEVCKLARYAGISDKVSIFGVFNLFDFNKQGLILSEILWYFIEGFHFRSNEYPFTDKSQYIKYNVIVDDMQLVFYKSNKSDRWWIEISHENLRDDSNKMNHSTLLPCSKDDYLRACDQEMPERWWRAHKKQIV